MSDEKKIENTPENRVTTDGRDYWGEVLSGVLASFTDAELQDLARAYALPGARFVLETSKDTGNRHIRHAHVETQLIRVEDKTVH